MFKDIPEGPKKDMLGLAFTIPCSEISDIIPAANPG